MDFANNRLTRYLKESKDELRKVVWPTRQETVRNTLLVIGISLGVALFLGLMDYILNFGLQRIIQK
ncbi:MAG: preprotein translocase subunit SecE [Patescibacteria group bacterium]